MACNVNMMHMLEVWQPVRLTSSFTFPSQADKIGSGLYGRLRASDCDGLKSLIFVGSSSALPALSYTV